MNKTKQYPKSAVHNTATQADQWNSKFKALVDTLQHHIHEKPGSKGMYVDFKQLK